jgi:hypothetical protein
MLATPRMVAWMVLTTRMTTVGGIDWWARRYSSELSALSQEFLKLSWLQSKLEGVAKPQYKLWNASYSLAISTPRPT